MIFQSQIDSKMLPKTSVLWVNYNSSHVIDITKKSLDSLAKIDYPNFEVILVDNASSDGSQETIEEYIKKNTFSHLRLKFLKLDKNYGWTGAINAAYRARSFGTKYVSLTHNDLIVRPNYLAKLVNFLETHENVGAVQGVITKLKNNLIVDSAGYMVYENLDLISFYIDKPVSLIQKPSRVSYVEGTMPVYNVAAVQDVLKDSRSLYVTEGFIYYLEDVFISLMLWSHNYECLVLPIQTGEHYRSGTSGRIFKSHDLFYYLLRNHLALLYMTNSKEKWLQTFKNFRMITLSKGTISQRKLMLNALLHGIIIGKRLQKRYGTIDLRNVPLVKMTLKQHLGF